jgi:hypothetical protein
MSLFPFPFPYFDPIHHRYLLLRYTGAIPSASARSEFAPWSDEMFRAVFTDANGWSVRDFWLRSSFGLLSFDIDMQPWRTIDLELFGRATNIPVPDDGGQNNRLNFIPFLKEQARSEGVPVDDYDQVIAFIHPPPSDAGAEFPVPSDALFDEDASLAFYQHEIGHVQGLWHTYGPDGAGSYAAYDDDYCVMASANSYHPVDVGPIPPGVTLAGQFPLSAPRLCAASLYRHVPAFSISSSIVYLSIPVTTELQLKGLSLATSGDRVLVVVRTFQGEVLIEFRPAVGDDAGVAPAVVIHSLDRYRPLAPGSPDPRPVIFEGKISLPEGGTFLMPEGDVSVSCPPTQGNADSVALTVKAQINIDVTRNYRGLVTRYIQAHRTLNAKPTER